VIQREKRRRKIGRKRKVVLEVVGSRYYLRDCVFFLKIINIKFITHSISSRMLKLFLFHKNILVKLHLECRNLVLQFPFIGFYYSLIVHFENRNLVLHFLFIGFFFLFIILHLECQNIILHYPFIGIHNTLFILCRNLFFNHRSSEFITH